MRAAFFLSVTIPSKPERLGSLLHIWKIWRTPYLEFTKVISWNICDWNKWRTISTLSNHVPWTLLQLCSNREWQNISVLITSINHCTKTALTLLGALRLSMIRCQCHCDYIAPNSPVRGFSGACATYMLWIDRVMATDNPPVQCHIIHMVLN